MCVCSLGYPAYKAHEPHDIAISTISRKGHDFLIIKKEVIGHTKCVLIVSTMYSETFLILRRNERDKIKRVYWPSCKVPVIIVRF